MRYFPRSLAISAIALVLAGCSLTTQDRSPAGKPDKNFPLGIWHEGAIPAGGNVVPFQFYPYAVDKKPNDIPTLRDYEAAADRSVAEARKSGADCFAVIQSHAVSGKLRSPLPAEIRAMTWLAIGTGVKGIFWFQDQEEVGRLTKELSPLAPSLLDLKPATDEKATVIRRKSMYPMTDSKPRKYLLAVNVDPSVPQTLHLSLKTPATRVLRLPDEKEIPSARKGDMLTWHEEFPPGAGALYRVE